MKGIRKYSFIWFLLFLLLLNTYGDSQGLASELLPASEEDTEQPDTAASYNIMLVIDKSGSMNETDEECLARDAAKMFVDSLNSANGIDGSRIGVMEFSLEAKVLAEPTELNSEKQLRDVKDRIQSITYDPVDTGGTNLGKAVKLAMDTLENLQDSTRENLILLFTDGYTTKRERQESDRLLGEALSRARETGCEIYIVGLNHKDEDGNDSILAEGRQKIAEIARNTQIRQGIYPAEDGSGRVNYLITDSILEVYDFYMDVYALLRGAVVNEAIESIGEDAAGNPLRIFEIPIMEPDVLEASIFVISNEPLGEIPLFDQNGNRVSMDGEHAFRSGEEGEERYAVLKLIYPGQGVWKIMERSRNRRYGNCFFPG